MPKKFSRYDLNGLVNHMLVNPKVLASRLKRNLRVTYSFPQTQKNFDKPYYKIEDLDVNLDNYRNFSPSKKLEKTIFKLALSSIEKVIPIRITEIDDKKFGRINGNIRVFNQEKIKTGEFYSLPAFTENIFISSNRMVTYLSLNLNNNDYRRSYKEFWKEYKEGQHNIDDSRVVENCRREVLRAFGIGFNTWPSYMQQKGLNEDVLSEYKFIQEKSVAANQLFFNPRYSHGSKQSGASLRVLDILALQALYGKNLKTNAKDNYYVIDSASPLNQKKNCLWDAGGTDTIAVSHTRNDGFLDMRDGKSSIINDDENFSLAYENYIENVKCDGSNVILNGLDNIINALWYDNKFYISDTHVVTKTNHKNPKQRVLQTVQRYTEANGKTYEGWGNKTYYSDSMEKLTYSSPDYFYIDVENPLNLKFNIKGKNLIVTCKSNSLRHKGRTFNSKLTILNFKAEPEKFCFMIRSKSEEQTKVIKEKFAKLYQTAQKNFEKRIGKPDDHLIKKGSHFGKRIAESDKEIAALTDTKLVKTHAYVPLAVGL